MKQQSWIFLFIIILLLLIFILSSKTTQKKEILPITFIDSLVHPKRIQDVNNPIVQNNLKTIEKANDMEFKRKLAGAPTICVFKPNKFITYTYEQFIDTFTGLILPKAVTPGPVMPMKAQNESLKLIDFNQIPSVPQDRSVFYGVAPKLFNKARDQGSCGSCWAYSAVTVIEAQVVKKFLIDNPAYLSTQYYIDCVKECRGCEGGFPIFVYEQVAKDGFVVWDAYAPYLGQESKVCQPPKEKFPFQLNGSIVFSKDNAAYFNNEQYEQAFQYQNLELEKLNEDMIDKIRKILFKYGPISALVYVDDKLPYFSNGIYMTLDSKDGVKQNPNHAVVIGGYGVNVYGEKYWVIRNSWGSEWGEDGYFPLSIDSPMSGFNIPVFDDIPPTL
jgi:hypothetical protein